MIPEIVMLCGGVGGARAATALYENLPSKKLTFIVNTGDDFKHLGLEIWPDWDTVVYHLGQVHEPIRGWGRADEGTRVMEELQRFPVPHWFHLGDRDLALHLYRTWSLNSGETHHEVIGQVLKGLEIEATVLRLTRDSCETKLELTDGSLMDFQDWFVKSRGKPVVKAVRTNGGRELELARGVEEALQSCQLLLFAPSNPYLSLGPMLANKRLAQLVSQLKVPRVAISPLIGGRALKGPLDSLIESLSCYRGQSAIAHYWSEWADWLLLPKEEISEVSDPPLSLLPCPTLLKSKSDRGLFCAALREHWKSLL
jgi:LPPG:FO 2-phospho-L-lactate transferase